MLTYKSVLITFLSSYLYIAVYFKRSFKILLQRRNIIIKNMPYSNTSTIYSMWPKVLPHVNKNPYIINKNHIFSKIYCEVISG